MLATIRYYLKWQFSLEIKYSRYERATNITNHASLLTAVHYSARRLSRDAISVYLWRDSSLNECPRCVLLFSYNIIHPAPI